MEFLKKLRDTCLTMAPIVLIVLFVHVFFVRIEVDLLIRFLFSALLIAVGEVLFLSGTDNSIMPMGEMVGNSAGTMKHVGVLVFFAFIFGFFATIAEPDVNVLATEVGVLGLSVPKTIFMFIIGAGVGLFVALALLRIMKSVSYKVLVFAILAICFVVAYFVPKSLIAVAFDAGGATTGIVTSPFLLAITAGITKNTSKKSHSDNFGVNGLASLGPVLAVLVMSLFATGEKAEAVIQNIEPLLDSLMSSLLAIVPLVAVFYLFDILFIKLPRKKKINLALGSMITFFGLFLFLFGINFGFLEMGEQVGRILSDVSEPVFLIICVVVGFVITFTEPAIRVLGAQVEDITQGNITRNGVTIALAISMCFAVLFAGLKIIFDLDIMVILTVGYGLACLLMLFSSKTFTALAFDSGGVASGPMTASFVLPLMLGFAEGTGNAGGGFGLIAIVGMMPVIVLGVLGVVYKLKVAGHAQRMQRIALRISYAERAYSNMDKLEEEYNRRHRDVSTDDDSKLESTGAEVVLD